MYYVLFETGNASFFENNIAAKFCTFTVQCIISLYKDGAFTGKGGRLDCKRMRENFKNNTLLLYFSNCQPLASIPCGNQECMTGHKAVLTLNQLETIEKIMRMKRDAFLRVDKSNDLDRLNLQEVFQHYAVANIQHLEVIKLEGNKEHAEYLQSYVKKTDNLKDKSDAGGFVYVRAKTNSDYDFFKVNTKLPDVMACDNFQHFVQ